MYKVIVRLYAGETIHLMYNDLEEARSGIYELNNISNVSEAAIYNEKSIVGKINVAKNKKVILDENTEQRIIPLEELSYHSGLETYSELSNCFKECKKVKINGFKWDVITMEHFNEPSSEIRFILSK